MLAAACVGSLALWSKIQLPIRPSEHGNFVFRALAGSTKGLSNLVLAQEATSHVIHIMQTMQAGKESEHLRQLLDLVDFRGSDFRLDSGSVLEGARQCVPYPAFCWAFKCVQSYSWKQSQHINVLELLAFFNFLRKIVAEGESSFRFLHVLDSRVAACVIAKGRSSSKILNRLLRRISSLSLAADSYTLPLWTISSWNFSDAGSRFVRPAGPPT